MTMVKGSRQRHLIRNSRQTDISTFPRHLDDCTWWDYIGVPVSRRLSFGHHLTRIFFKTPLFSCYSLPLLYPENFIRHSSSWDTREIATNDCGPGLFISIFPLTQILYPAQRQTHMTRCASSFPIHNIPAKQTRGHRNVTPENRTKQAMKFCCATILYL